MRLTNLTLLIFLLVSLASFSQKVEHTYYYDYKVKEEYQVNSKGVKHGYYKKFWTDGSLEIKGTYSNNVKTGTWTSYDDRGRTFSIENYKNGKYHGLYKQWCTEGGIGTNGKYYLCNESTYDDGREVTITQYYPNGKKSKEIDVTKSIYNEWFEDGTAKSEIINGKIYISGEDSDGENRRVERIKFDSLDLKIEYFYGFVGQWDGTLRDINVHNFKDESSKTWRFDDGLMIKYFLNGKECKINDNVLAEGYRYYNIDPNPETKKFNSKNNKRYNEKTKGIDFYNDDGSIYQTIIGYYNDSIQTIVSYHSNGNRYQEYKINPQGKKIGFGIEYNEDGIKIVETDWESVNHKEFYDTGELKSHRTCCFYREYDKSGNLILENEPYYQGGDRIDYGKTYHYNSSGIIIKVESDGTILEGEDAVKFYFDYKSKILQEELSDKQKKFVNASIETNPVLYHIGITELNTIASNFLNSSTINDRKNYHATYIERADYLIELSSNENERNQFIEKVIQDSLNSVKSNDNWIRKISETRKDKVIFDKYDIVFIDLMKQINNQSNQEQKYNLILILLKFQNEIKGLFENPNKEIEKQLKKSSSSKEILSVFKL